jgi:hypothetical protein
MKLKGWQLFLLAGMAIPLLLLCGGFPAWTWGMVLGECLGAISFSWVSLTVRRVLFKQKAHIYRQLIGQAFFRYVFIGGVFFLAIKWPAVNIWAVLIGYSLIQLPAAALRAIQR